MRKIVFILLSTTFFIRCNNNVLPDVNTPPPVNTIADRIPLNDPNQFSYDGNASGLYPWGNTMIANAYQSNYQSISQSIGGIDAAGNHTPTGKIVILAIGGSNPEKVFSGIETAQKSDRDFGSQIVFINGGLPARDLYNITAPNTGYWNSMQDSLDAHNLTAEQVQVIFCIEDDLKTLDTTFNRVTILKNDYEVLLGIIRDKYPNCKLFLVGDRGYSGYATLPNHVEPVGYLNGWGVKQVVADYINNQLPEYPLVNWLDYYWADGTTPRWDGLTYFITDFIGPDYVHFTEAKANELGSGTHNRLKADSGASYWYK